MITAFNLRMQTLGVLNIVHSDEPKYKRSLKHKQVKLRERTTNYYYSLLFKGWWLMRVVCLQIHVRAGKHSEREIWLMNEAKPSSLSRQRELVFVNKVKEGCLLMWYNLFLLILLSSLLWLLSLIKSCNSRNTLQQNNIKDNRKKQIKKLVKWDDSDGVKLLLVRFYGN